jgi:cytochrome c peroxidase
VGTFNPTRANEVRAGNLRALGILGYVPSSLLGVGALAPYLHDGSAATLDDVLANRLHRSAGGGGDKLSTEAERRDMVNFLKSIDASTAPFAQGTLPR